MHPTLNKRLHRVAGDYAGDTKQAHQIVKLFAREELGVESVADLTNAQAQELIRLMRAARNHAMYNIKNATGSDLDEEASERQRSYIADLQKQLGWSEKYMNALIKNRWGTWLHPSQQTLTMVPRWVAVRLIALMRQRLTSKQHHTGGNDEVQPRHTNHAQGTRAIRGNLYARSASTTGQRG